ncbi:MAG: undecaprenyl-diphosphate phosphatase [Clostridia bacterium]
MDYLVAIILGIVEGLTEFLPVSSTGHMILTADLLNFTGEKAKTFEIVIQLGSIMAVVVLYWRRFLSLLGWDQRRNKRPRLNLLHVIVAMVPAGVLGVALHGVIKQYLFGPQTVLIGLIAGGVLMIVAEKLPLRTTSETLDDISYKQAFGIGLFQCLALWPGFSRSGATIAGGRLLGTSHKAAAEFTFLVAVPVMVGASGLDLLKSYQNLALADLGFFITGFVTAFLVAMFAIVSFLKLLQRFKLTPFAYYRFVLAVLFYFFLLR